MKLNLVSTLNNPNFSGFCLVCTLTAFGATFCYLLARLVGQDLALKYFSSKISAFKNKLDENYDRSVNFEHWMKLNIHWDSSRQRLGYDWCGALQVFGSLRATRCPCLPGSLCQSLIVTFKIICISFRKVNFNFQDSIFPTFLAAVSGVAELGDQHVLRRPQRAAAHLLRHRPGKLAFKSGQFLYPEMRPLLSWFLFDGHPLVEKTRLPSLFDQRFFNWRTSLALNV